MMTKPLRKIWMLILITGMFTAIVGLLIIATPYLIRHAIERMIAIMLILGGIAQGVYTLSAKKTVPFCRAETVQLSAVLALLSLLVALIIFVHPLDTFITFTVLIAIYFGLEGALRIGFGLSMRAYKVFVFPLIVGITSIIFSLLIWFYMAGAQLSVIANLIGILFLARGLVQVVLALKARDFELKVAEGTASAVCPPGQSPAAGEEKQT